MASPTTNGDGAGIGRLLVCATPIGNLGDITERVVAALDGADVVYAEDTRVTRKLLSHLGVSTPVERCDENVTAERIPQILARLDAGQSVAFVSDAGMPCVSDPGQRVVAAARAAGHEVTVLPGASAVLTAVAGSGFPARSFYFGGFLPRKAGERSRLLGTLAGLDAALVFFESNHRTVTSLRAIAEALPGRRVCMARELTKLHEEYAVAPAAELADQLEARDGELKGEVVLVIEPPVAGEAPSSEADESSIADRARELAEGEGLPPSRVAKALASEFGISRDEAYRIARESRG